MLTNIFFTLLRLDCCIYGFHYECPTHGTRSLILQVISVYTCAQDKSYRIRSTDRVTQSMNIPMFNKK